MRSKTYDLKKLVLFPSVDAGEERQIVKVKKLKGIQKCVVKKTLSLDHYKSGLFDKMTHMATTTSLRSHLHEIRTLYIRKVAMTLYDDNRYLLDDGITSLPYGHKTLL